MIKEIASVPQNNPCEGCNPCLRLRMMEMGLIDGQLIDIETKRLGLYIVNILSENEDVVSTIALRQEEFDRICLK
jgi:hypothetical protein